MLVVRLSSGIGNQLFQYAFALYLKEKYQDTVYLESSSYKYRTSKRRFTINIISELPTTSDKRIYYNYRPRFYKLCKAIFSLNPFVRSINESNLTYPKNNKFIYFDGFWQSDYFVSHLTDYKKYFKPLEAMPASMKGYLEDIRSSDSISMHVRRGDFFSEEFRHKYGVCDSEYYKKALDVLTKNTETRKLFIFTDDLDWVKENLFLSVKYVVFIRNEEINPFWFIYLMSNCKDNIISNSSFSWWGAYLNENPQKKVVAPKIWMNGEEKTIALDSWIKI